jgi:hypothetical protein
MATQYKILVGDTDAPEIRVPATGDDSYLAPVTLDEASGTEASFEISTTINQSGTAAATDLLINRTETAVGSGAQLLADFQVGGSSKFSVRNDGLIKGTSNATVSIGADITLTNPNAARPINVSSAITNITGILGIGEGVGTTDSTATTYLRRTAEDGAEIVTSNTSTSGSVTSFQITPTYNQTSGTAQNTDLLINRTETAVGSGSQYLIDAQVDGVSKFSVNNGGYITAPRWYSTSDPDQYINMGNAGYFSFINNAGDETNRYGASKLEAIPGWELLWAASAASVGGAKDTGLARDSAGLVKVTDGSTGDGDIIANAFRLPTSNAATVLSLTHATNNANHMLLTNGVTGYGLSFYAHSGAFNINALNGAFLGFSSGSSTQYTTPDVGLARDSAGVIKVTDGSTGGGTEINGVTAWIAASTTDPT